MGVESGLGVDAETGEVLRPCQRCEILLGQIEVLEANVAGLQRDILGWTARYRQLERDKEREARKHPRWTEIKELFDYWRKTCRQPDARRTLSQARFNAERFELALPYVEKDGIETCRRAIRGAGYDPFVTRRRNGKRKAHNGWELIFSNRGKFDDMVERAPAEAADPSELKDLASAILAEMPEDDRPTADRIHEAVGRAQAELRRRS